MIALKFLPHGNCFAPWARRHCFSADRSSPAANDQKCLFYDKSMKLGRLANLCERNIS